MSEQKRIDKCIFFNIQKGFGFLSDDAGPDVYIGAKEGAHLGLLPGMLVSFRTEVSRKNGRPMRSPSRCWASLRCRLSPIRKTCRIGIGTSDA
jgi:cold shock CspA family protein